MTGKKTKPSMNIFDQFFLPPEDIDYDRCHGTFCVKPLVELAIGGVVGTSKTYG